MLTLEVIASIIAGLLLLSFTMASIRAAVEGTAAAWTTADVAPSEKKTESEGWIHRCLVAFDIAVNVIVLRGQQDETISTHSWRAQQEGKLWGKLMCKWLNGFQPNHGFRAASGDLERAKSRVAQLSKMLGAD